MAHKILFTIPNFITAGSGQAMLNIIQRLDRQHFAPAVCVQKKGGRLDGLVEEMGIPLLEADFTLPPKPYLSLPARVHRAAQAFRPYGFDLWHSFHYSDDYTEALVARCSGAKAWVYTKKNMGWGSRAWRLRSLVSTRIAVQNTDMLKQFFNEWPLKSKARFIQRGVDTERFSPLAGAETGLLATLDIPQGVPVIGVVAHLVPVKGHPTLIDALARVPFAHLLVAGKPLDAGYVAALEEQVDRLGLTQRVHFLGGIEDVAGLLVGVNVFVLPTRGTGRMEGCPVALLEAMACGKACIATDIPGSRDLVVHRESGLLVPPDDAAALVDALNLLLKDEDLRKKYGLAARRRVVGQFSIEREVADHETLYDEVLGKP